MAHLPRGLLAGTAGPYAEIELQLFPESVKEVELFLLDQSLAYSTSEAPRSLLTWALTQAFRNW